MRRLITALCLLLPLAAHADVTLTGVDVSGKGTAVASYSGPGDVISGAVAWYGLRAYSLAYATGNGKIVNVRLTTNSHTCDILSTTGGNLGNTANCSTGGDNAQAAATFCGANCAVVTWYDQSGANACSAAACDVTQSTAANQPALTFSCFGSLPCVTFAGGSVGLAKASSPTNATPVSFSDVSLITNACAGQCTILVSDSAAQYIGTSYLTSGGTLKYVVYNNSSCGLSASCRLASQSTLYANQYVSNGASSITNQNGTDSATFTLQTHPLANTLNLGNDTFAEAMIGSIGETGIWPAAFSAGQRTNMCHNQKAYWTISGATC